MAVMSETRTYVEFWYPGAFVAESSVREVDDRDVAKLVVPENAYAFSFYDIMTSTVNGTPLRSERLNKSPRYFYGGRIMSLADVQAEVPGSRILQDNMRINGYSRVIQCRTGNFQPFTDRDIFVSAR